MPATASSPSQKDVTLRAADGAGLAATLYSPARNRGVSVVINSATAVPRSYYASFARHLAQRGIAVLTYDYRGIGGSAGIHGTMEDWGRLDQAAAIDFLAAENSHERVALVGHSLGGQILGLTATIGRVKAAFLVSSQHGYWRHWKGPPRARMWLLWWILIPGLTRLLGRFPGHWLGTGRLPAGVALNWARWGRSPHYLCDSRGAPLRPHNSLVTFPIRWLSFTDDSVAPFAAVEALRAYYPNAPQERLHLSPAELGVPAVGHFGFFRKSMPSAHWDAAAEWLLARTAGA